MAIQGLCPFSWSMGLNLVREGEDEGEKKRRWSWREKKDREECKNEVEVVRRGNGSEALINISPYRSVENERSPSGMQYLASCLPRVSGGLALEG